MLVALGVVACTIRLIHVLTLSRTPVFGVLVGDSKRYIDWASEIAGGDWLGSEVFYQAPFYPYVLGAAFAAFGRSVDLVRILHAIAGATACVLVAAAGRRIFDWRAGLAAGAALAVYPAAIFFDGHLQKASLDLLLMAAVIAGIAEYVSSRRVRWIAAAGIALGCLMLNRENARVLFPFLIVWLAIRDRDLPMPRRARVMAAFTLATLLPIAPVALRNYAISGEVLISTAQLGPNFYIGNHAGASGVYDPLVPGRGSVAFEREDATRLATAARGRPLSPGEVSEYWFSTALDDIRRDPGGWARLMIRKLLLSINTIEPMDTESLEFHAANSPMLSLLRPFTFGVLLPLAVLGMVLTRADVRRLTVLYGIAILFMGSVVVFFVMARYRHPVVAVLMLFAGAALVRVRDAWRLRRREALTGIACAALLALVVNTPMRVTSEETYGNFGNELVRLDRPREAIPLLEKAVALLPNDAGVHRDLGLAYAKAGEAAAAVREYTRVAELEPLDAANHRELAVIADAAGDSATALMHFREAARLEPASIPMRLKLGDLLVRLDRVAEARQTYAEVLAKTAVAPADAVGVRVRIASLDLRAGRPRDALTLLEEAAALARATGQIETASDLEKTIGGLRGR